MKKNPFTLLKKDNEARAGVLQTIYGDIPTPMFMPVGTRASVKTLWQEDLEEIGAKIILGNTYHLYLRPGHELIGKHGGLHQFMKWNKSILTDSGGFQVFSLSTLNKITQDGVMFKSHIDGSSHFISPEKSMEIQKYLNSDFVMAFDECPKLPASKSELAKSMELTLLWAQKCRDFDLNPNQNLLGIIQGGLHLDLRQECMERLKAMNFDGYAIGGLSVGEKNEEMVEFCKEFAPKMPEDRVRYLMGVGTPIDIIRGIKAGIDIFDCVLPTRNARNGQFLTWDGPINIKKNQFISDMLPPDPECDCKVCRKYTRSYIRHLFTSGEYLAGQMISYHNIYFYIRLVEKARDAILQGQFNLFFETFCERYLAKKWS